MPYNGKQPNPLEESILFFIGQIFALDSAFVNPQISLARTKAS